MAKFGYFASGSSLALALGMGMAGTAAAQAPAPAESEADVVITGSFIRGTPEDAAIPVRAITLQELQNMGTPSNLDLVKSMVDSGSVRGEGDRRGAGSSIGVQTINLRQLGSARTLVLLNGRRLQDQSSAGVRFANTAVIPNAVIGRVDTLRDGGAVRYGSDAVGGVVNFITRHDFNGLQVRGNYRFVEDSDGDYDADLLWGSSNENGNIMLALQFQHRSTIDLVDREWALKDYLQNNASLAWTATGNPGTYTWNTSTNAFGIPTGAIVPATGTSAALTSYSATNASLAGGDFLRQMGATGVFRDPGCSTAIGAFPGWSVSTSPACYFSLNQTEKLAETQDTYGAYLEMNYEFSQSARYHGEAVYYQLQAPEVMNTPSEGTSSYPVVAVTCTGVDIPAGIGCLGAGQIVRRSQATTGYYTIGANPAVRDLIDRFVSYNGAQTLSTNQINAIVGTGGVTLSAWRPYGISGNPFTGRNEIQKNRVDQFRMTHELSGDLPKVFGTDLQWKADVTGIYTVFPITARDILVDRMQAALNGLGGPNCNGIRADQVGSTCQWFNPFSTAMPGNVYLHTANPTYMGPGSTTVAGYPAGGLTNSYSLAEWLHTTQTYERNFYSLESNFQIDGDTPIELPGGPIAVAFGGQYRYQKDKHNLTALADQNSYPCTIGVDCPWSSGPGFGNRWGAQFGVRQETNRYYPAWSAFGAVSFPVFDNLDIETSVRYEKFISDTGTINNSVLAPQGQARWQVTDWLALRGVVGSTFANVTPPENNPPTVTSTNATVAYGQGTGASTFLSVNAPNPAVSPEKGLNYNVGVIFKSGPLAINLDYYNIKLDNLALNITAANVMNALAVDPTAPQVGTALINCSSFVLTQPQAGLSGLPFITLNPGTNAQFGGTGTCTQGVTNFNDAFNNAGGQAIVRFFGSPRNVNGGEFQTDGIDLASSLTFDDVLGGRLVLNLDGTKVLNWDMGDFFFGGAKISSGYDGVGSFNLAGSKGGTGETVFEYKANMGANFTHGRHNFNWRTTYTSAIDIDTTTTLLARSNTTNANISTPGEPAGVVDGNDAHCGTSPTLTNGESGVIAGAGQGQWGVWDGARIGYCAANNASLTGGTGTFPASFYSDFTYRVNLPWETVVTATVQNVFDRDPSFARVAQSYNSFLESPTGRTFRIGLQKKF